MIVKKMQLIGGNATVLATADNYNDYIAKGYEYVEDIEIEVTNSDNVPIEMQLDEDGNTQWRYSGDFEWNTIAGGGTSVPKVKVNSADSTSGYLAEKIVEGDNITLEVVDNAGVKTLKINSTASGGGSGVTVYADLAALKAVDTTAYTTVQTVQVTSLGLYKFQPASTLTGDDVNVIQPTVGSSAGRWVKQSIENTEQSTTFWGKVQVPTAKDRQIKTTSLTKSKKVVFIGSSVLLGTGVSTYADSYAGKLTTALQNETDITFVGFENRGITGNAPLAVVNRVVNEVCSLNPDIVVVGLCSNNSGLYTQTSELNAAKTVSNYIEGILQITSMLEERGIAYVVTGEYGVSSATEFGIRAKKVLNFQLSKLFKNKYMNFLGTVANDTDTNWVTAAGSVDGAHPGNSGHNAIYNNIDINIFKEPYASFNNFLEYAGYCTMNITTGYQALYVAPLGTTTTTYINEYTAFVDVNKGIGANNKILIKTKRSTSIAGIVVRTDANGYIAIYEGAILKNTTTIQLKEKEMTRICISTNSLTGKCKVLIDNVDVYSWTLASTLNANLLDLKLGGNGNDTLDNAIGYGFANLVIYKGMLDDYAISKCFSGEWFLSNIIFAHNLNIINTVETTLNSQHSHLNGKIVAYLQDTTVFTNQNTAVIKYTNTEKAKLANAISGTFTTNDGKTITITGGMVTSIV